MHKIIEFRLRAFNHGPEFIQPENPPPSSHTVCGKDDRTFGIYFDQAPDEETEGKRSGAGCGGECHVQRPLQRPLKRTSFSRAASGWKEWL